MKIEIEIDSSTDAVVTIDGRKMKYGGAVRAGGYGPTIPMRPIGWNGGPTTWAAEVWT